MLHPILFILTPPLQILTLGLFTHDQRFSAWWVAHWGLGLTVDGLDGVLAAIVLGIVSFVLSMVVSSVEGRVSRPRILVTNDDGYRSKGIGVLAAALSSLGDVLVVAPDGDRSGIGHALSIKHPVHVAPMRAPR